MDQKKQPRKKLLKRKRQRKNKMKLGKADDWVRLFTLDPISQKYPLFVSLFIGLLDCTVPAVR